MAFFSGKKESHQRKLPGERERVRAERSVGPSLRWALGSLIDGLAAVPVTGWFYRSFANSFTLCLIWFARAARVAYSCGLWAVGLTIFSSPAKCELVGSWGMEHTVIVFTNRCQPLSYPPVLTQ